MGSAAMFYSFFLNIRPSATESSMVLKRRVKPYKNTKSGVGSAVRTLGLLPRGVGAGVGPRDQGEEGVLGFLRPCGCGRGAQGSERRGCLGRGAALRDEK